MNDPIRRVAFHWFRSFQQASVELRDLNVLIGVNGAGKSNFIDGLMLLRDIAAGRFQEFVAQRVGAHRILHRGGVAPGMGVEVRSDRVDYVAQLGASEVDRLFFLSEGFTTPPGREGLALHHDPQSAFSRPGQRESALVHYQGVGADEVEAFAARLRGIQRWHFMDTRALGVLRQAADLHDNRGLDPHGGNLAAWLYLLRSRHRGAFTQVQGTLRLVAPFIAELVVEPQALNPHSVVVQWRQVGLEGLFDVGHLSDGTLRFLALASVLLQPEPPSLIVLDEPELGLHPHALHVLVELLQDAARRTQVIVATQSRQIVDLVAAEDVIIAQREGAGTTLRRLDTEGLRPWLDEYSQGELWEMNVLSGVGG